MRTLIVGSAGHMGRKWRDVIGADGRASIDPRAAHNYPPNDYTSLDDVPVTSFDAAIVCTPNDQKYEICKRLLTAGKHVLVEKPFIGGMDCGKLCDIAVEKALKFHISYNHRFEPAIVQMDNVLKSGRLGRIYHFRMLYGNGTARDILGTWKDTGSGVIAEVASHLIDLGQMFFGKLFMIQSESSIIETKAPDFFQALLSFNDGNNIEIETSFLCWKNTFTIDVYAENGSAHVDGLMKWGPSHFIYRERVYPSGPPIETTTVWRGPDRTFHDTWEMFKKTHERRFHDQIETASRLAELERMYGK